MAKEPFDIKKFAAERSHQNTKDSTELGRSAAQAAIYINGATAGGILAFVRDTKPESFRPIVIGLTVYGLGVLFGAWMMFCKNQLLHARSDYWQSYFNPSKLGEEARTNADRKSRGWWLWSNLSFGASIICFIVGSVWLANALYGGKTDVKRLAAPSLAAPVGHANP